MFDFIRFPWMTAGNPLDNPKAAQRWIKQIRQGVVAEVCERVSGMLKQFNESETAMTLEKLLALMYIDEQVQESFLMLAHQYVTNPRMAKPIQERLWRDVSTLVRSMSQAYLKFIDINGNHPEQTAIDQRLGLMIGRTLHYLGLAAKWQYFVSENPDPLLWKTVHRLYRLSEIKGFDSDPMALYPSQALVTTTCTDEYLQVLMLQPLNTGAFTPRQLEQVDAWLDKWSGLLALERQYNANRHSFMVDLGRSGGVMRAEADAKGDHVRYVQTQDLMNRIASVVTALQKGESPMRHDLGADARMPGCLELLQQLQQLWSSEKTSRYRRSSERKPVKKVLEVVHGVADLFEATRYQAQVRALEARTDASPLNYDEMLDMRLYGFVTEQTKAKQVSGLQQQSHDKMVMPDAESWMVENESDSGYGAILPAIENEWVRIGCLVGIREADADVWRVAVLRRLVKNSSEELFAGVQLLLDRIEPVEMRLISQRGSGLTVDGVDPFAAYSAKNGLFVMAGHGNDRPSLLLQTADYAQGKQYRLMGEASQFQVRMKDVIEKGVDWTWAAVEPFE